MIRLYTWPTPNGQQVQIMLEELEADYESLDRLRASDDFIEGPRSSAEKRRPRWRE